MKIQRQERGARWSHPWHQGRAGTQRHRYRRWEASEVAQRGDEHIRASLGSQMVKSQPATQEMWAQSLGREDPLKEGMVTHCNTHAWKSPWTEEPGGLRSTGSQRAGHHWPTNTFTSRPLEKSRSAGEDRTKKAVEEIHHLAAIIAVVAVGSTSDNSRIPLLMKAKPIPPLFGVILPLIFPYLDLLCHSVLSPALPSLRETFFSI